MFLAVSDFREILRSAAEQFESKGAFAKAIGITPSRLSRALKGIHKLNTLNCLRLSKLAGLDPSAVLRAAGKDKAQIADLIESLYGNAAPAITRYDRELLDEWHAMTDAERTHVRYILRSLPHEATGEATRKRQRRTA